MFLEPTADCKTSRGGSDCRCLLHQSTSTSRPAVRLDSQCWERWIDHGDSTDSNRRWLLPVNRSLVLSLNPCKAAENLGKSGRCGNAVRDVASDTNSRQANNFRQCPPAQFPDLRNRRLVVRAHRGVLTQLLPNARLGVPARSGQSGPETLGRWSFYHFLLVARDST